MDSLLLKGRLIAKIDHSVGKTALVPEIQPYAYVAGKHPNASAKHSRRDEQMILVDEPGPDRLGGEGRTSHRNIERRLSLQLADRLRVEFPLQTRVRCRDGLPRFGIDDLVGRLPDAREVQHGRRGAGNDLWRLPNRHRFVLLASIEIGADRAVEIGNERKCLLAWRRPIEVAVIRDKAILGRLAPVSRAYAEWPTTRPGTPRNGTSVGRA